LSTNVSTPKNGESFDFSGQVALVTGGGRGLGRAFAQALAGRGAKVAVTARTEQELAATVALIEEAGGTAIALPADVTDHPEVIRVVEAVEEQLGPVDVLANNAGVLGPSGRDWEVDVDDWWHTFDVNLRGAFLFARAVLPGMIARHRGRIVNISSASVNIHLPYASAYGVSKAALTYLANCLDSATKEYGVFVFAYAPGFVRTDVIDQVAESYNIRKSVVDIYRKRLEDDHDTTLERAVEVFMFLASGRADQLSGRHIDVYDDEVELVERADDIRRDDLYTLRRRV
jgi:NAD(P)-dependent dehydrogenase (short-subunit alcohol dehydrogenase family)